MGGNAVKSIVLLMVLVVLSFVVGAQVSDSMSDSYGAFVLIGMIALGFVMLLLGEKSMALLIILPCALYDIYAFPGLSGLRSQPVPFVFSTAIAMYALLLWIMRYVHFRWRGMLILDVLVFILTIYFIGNYIAYPTAIAAFTEDAEYVGGKEYMWLALGLVYYIMVSAVDFPAQTLPKLIHRVFWACVGVHVLYLVGAAAMGRLGSMLSTAASGDAVRFTFFNYIVPLGIYYFYASGPLGRIVVSLRSWFFLGGSSFMLLMGGRREIFLATGLAVAFMAFLKREFSCILLIVLMLYGGLFVLSSQHVLLTAPHSVQRVLSVVPGMEISRTIAQGTKGSSDTRREVWKYGLDPRTGFIKNYIWGDGFRMSLAYISRSQTAVMRRASEGLNILGDERQAYVFARGGLWHNGFLATVHHTGIIGLAIVICFFIVGAVMICAISRAYWGNRYYPAIMAMVMPWMAFALSYSWGSSDLCGFFGCWVFLGIIKLMYCAAREQGLLRPLFLREQYVPMTIRELETGN